MNAMDHFKSAHAVEECADLHAAAISALLNITGSSSHRIGGAGGGAIREIVTDVLENGVVECLVNSMQLHQFHAGVQQQACNLLLSIAECDEPARHHMARCGVREVVMAAIQRDVLCEMRISLQCARNLLRLLCHSSHDAPHLPLLTMKMFEEA